SAAITNCSIIANGGDGVWARSRISPSLTNCVIAGNKKAGVDAISLPIIINCTVVGNGLTGISSNNARVVNCIVWDNVPPQIIDSSPSALVTYSDVQGGYSGEGNIDADPLFVDAAGGNFHLLPSSPAIDAGDPTFDYATEPWPNGGRVNMGAYGNTNEATRSPADFDDLALLCEHWLEYEPSLDIAPPPAGDGIINFLDYAVLADLWVS
ncbi:MAG: right-handed parallel beta-helix repeat-containing protein, partial [Planctomycetota bacterium]